MFEQNWSLSDYVSKITCPLVLVQGELDEYATINQIDKIAALSKGKSTKLIYPSLKHFPHLEQKGMVLNDMMQALRQYL